MENLNRRKRIQKILKIANLLIRNSKISKEIKRNKIRQQKMRKIQKERMSLQKMIRKIQSQFRKTKIQT